MFTPEQIKTIDAQLALTSDLTALLQVDGRWSAYYRQAFGSTA